MERLPAGELSKTRTATLTSWILQGLLSEYHRAAGHLKTVGAQTPSSEYGGSRSIIYLAVMSEARTLPDMLAARRAYHEGHSDPEPYNDERGALLRIAAYRLRGIPILGNYLEDRARIDDAAMAGADFTTPTTGLG